MTSDSNFTNRTVSLMGPVPSEPVSPREIEKLKALCYRVELMWARRIEHKAWAPSGKYLTPGYARGSEEAWAACKSHAQSSEGLKATMADKVKWLQTFGRIVVGVSTDGQYACLQRTPFPKDWVEILGDSPEAAVDALFWTVP